MTITTAISEEQFRDAVAAAIRAPSMYNAQPWRFALRDGSIQVRLDPDRMLPVADPDRWAARVACGAAAADVRLALAVAGMATDMDLSGDDDDGLLVATIIPTGPRKPTPDERALHAAIPARHSNRQPFFDAVVPAYARARMAAAATNAGASLLLADDRPTVARIAEIVRAADERLHADAAYVAELRAWVGGHNADRSGIGPVEAGPAPVAQDLLARRDFGGSARAPGRDFETDPLLGVLTFAGSGRYSDARAGVALQMVLLSATEQRLATSMLSQPIEVPESREELRRALGESGRPYMVIRIGFGQPLGASSSRRDIDSVIDPMS